mmetsp:Transcript_94059/g.269624  ORF Transcript_94059/g.269624 Transcript_94059/m.269624 type:complete len:177 (-) Transcript_94059:172-702(-)
MPLGGGGMGPPSAGGKTAPGGGGTPNMAGAGGAGTKARHEDMVPFSPRAFPKAAATAPSPGGIAPGRIPGGSIPCTVPGSAEPGGGGTTSGGGRGKAEGILAITDVIGDGGGSHPGVTSPGVAAPKKDTAGGMGGIGSARSMPPGAGGLGGIFGITRTGPFPPDGLGALGGGGGKC